MDWNINLKRKRVKNGLKYKLKEKESEKREKSKFEKSQKSKEGLKRKDGNGH